MFIAFLTFVVCLFRNCTSTAVYTSLSTHLFLSACLYFTSISGILTYLRTFSKKLIQKKNILEFNYNPFKIYGVTQFRSCSSRKKSLNLTSLLNVCLSPALYTMPSCFKAWFLQVWETL